MKNEMKVENINFTLLFYRHLCKNFYTEIIKEERGLVFTSHKNLSVFSISFLLRSRRLKGVRVSIKRG